MGKFISVAVVGAYSTQFCSHVTVKPYRPRALASRAAAIRLHFRLVYPHKLLKHNKIDK